MTISKTKKMTKVTKTKRNDEDEDENDDLGMFNTLNYNSTDAGDEDAEEQRT